MGFRIFQGKEDESGNKDAKAAGTKAWKQQCFGGQLAIIHQSLKNKN